ncbi:MAG: hypothetical protein KTR21_06040 [Rhodobacteraceae bacterium]|nr:hypothetical protein [Paracoccaceae bacterium]
MNMIVKKIDGRLVVELPEELVARLDLKEGDEIDPTPLLRRAQNPDFTAALDAVVEEHADALRELAK